MLISIDLYDLLSDLRSEGFVSDDVVADVRKQHKNQSFDIDADVDIFTAAEGLSSDTLIDILADRGCLPALDGNVEAIGEALTYARRGDLILAEAMIGRAIGGDADMRPIERALRS